MVFLDQAARPKTGARPRVLSGTCPGRCLPAWAPPWTRLAREPLPGVEVNRMLSYGPGYYHFGVRKGPAPLAAILNKGIQSLRQDGQDGLGPTMNNLPGAASLPRLLPVAGAQADTLAARPVWRVGAVRGLSLLNEVDVHGLHTGIAAEYTEQVVQRLGVAVQVLAFDSVAAALGGDGPAAGLPLAPPAAAVGTWWWMRRLKREVLARQRSEQLLSDMATTVPGVAFRYVLAADGSLRHHFYTIGARAFLGLDLDPKATVLATRGPRMAPEDRRHTIAQQTRCAASGERFQLTCRHQHPDGRPRWLRAEAVQTRTHSGQPVWTGYLVDVSAERDLQQRLADAAESRNLLLASASHELRSPTHL
jgi:hypothetical protein